MSLPHTSRLTTRSVTCAALSAVVWLCAAGTAHAQDGLRRFEVGVSAAGENVTNSPRGIGGGFSFDLNVAPRLAIESKIIVFRAPNPLGATLQLSGGIRALLIRYPRFGLYGVALPGLYRQPWPRFVEQPISQTTSSPSGSTQLTGVSFQPVPEYSQRTHYVLDMGLGGSFVLGPNVVIRFEWLRSLHAQPAIVDSFPYFNETLIRPGHIGSEWNVQTGASYRFGSPLARPAPATYTGRWTAGPQLAFTLATGPVGAAGAGGFISYRLLRYCDVEGSASTWLRAALPTDTFEGGRMSQALLGVKVGVREGRVGVFFHISSGVNSYSSVVSSLSRDGIVVTRSTVPALNLGGAVEFAATRRTILRIDLGETLSFARGPATPGQRTERDEIYTLPVRVGLGWRF